MFMDMAVPLPLYTEFIQTQPICASVTLHHAKFIELLLASCCSTADVPLLGAHDLVEAIRGAVRPSSTSLRCTGYWEGFGVGR